MLYGGFNTRRCTLVHVHVHGLCFFKLFPIGCIGLSLWHVLKTQLTTVNQCHISTPTHTIHIIRSWSPHKQKENHMVDLTLYTLEETA